MGIVDSPDGRSGKKGARGWRHKRAGFHLDMTPMVDVAFLLLTFFMLTTTFSKSNTMAISSPPDNREVKMAEHNVLTIRIADDATAWCSLGGELPKKIPFDSPGIASQLSPSSELRQFLEQQAVANNKMVIVVKISDKAKYRTLVDIIDELNLLNISRFTLDDYTAQDALEIQQAM